jgi:hypothetical protein
MQPKGVSPTTEKKTDEKFLLINWEKALTQINRIILIVSLNKAGVIKPLYSWLVLVQLQFIANSITMNFYHDF